LSVFIWQVCQLPYQQASVVCYFQAQEEKVQPSFFLQES